jgi:DNA polymerase-3 subunit alpha
MEELFAQYPDAIANTRRIADMCHIELEVGKWHLPKFPCPDGLSSEEYLKVLVEEKLPGVYPNMTPEIRERIDYEMGIICQKGYAPYFLIVGDFVNWAKNQGIGVGPGRGSAAGSVICRILNITGIDPFYFKLPFERFLNPFRPSAPDIDLDFADDRREEVIKYVTELYGSDKVAQIITFGTMEAKAAIRDGGRALGMPYIKPDRIAKMIPPPVQGKNTSLEKALEESAELGLAYRTEPDTKKLIDVAKKLEGVARHSSVHAAGVVIADKPLVEYTPIQKEAKGERIITQYDMYTVGENGVGLLKMDFLGLRNLTILTQAVKFIKDVRGEVVNLDTIPLDDKTSFDMLSSGETTGVFQLESSGMRRYIKELQPTNIFDLMAMVALYRPGPIATIPEFIRRKHDPSTITYPDPRLKEVLAQSYGIISYQDDVLLTAITLAGYSWGDADKLRKAVGKKIASEMKKQREHFIEGCVANGLTQTKAEGIFDLIEPFAGYGFNKAHAACYAMIAYQTAYLKANYKVEYMTAVLTAESRANTGPLRDEKITSVVAECRRMLLPLLPPDVNHSGVEFSVENNAIRFGLSAIKNVGSAAIDSIVLARKDGPFTSIYDFIRRVDLSKVNKKTLESMIRAGACLTFGNRAQLLASIPMIVDATHKIKKVADTGQTGLFDLSEVEDGGPVDAPLPDMPELTKTEILLSEKELLGIYLTEHPLSQYATLLESEKPYLIGSYSEEDVGTKVMIIGLLADIKKILTKANNSEMAFLRVEDLTGTIEVVIFPKLYAKIVDVLKPDKIVKIFGKLDLKDDRKTLIADDVKPMVFK